MKVLYGIFVTICIGFTGAAVLKNLGIISGSTTLPHFIPSLTFLSINGSMSLRCGGSLITKNYVLTAAQCLKHATTVQVVLGAFDVTAAEPSQVKYDVVPAQYIIHENFNETSLENDIALIKLPESVNLNENITTIPVNKPAQVSNLVGQQVITIGWGTQSDYLPNLYSNVPYAIWINVTDNKNSECVEWFGDRIKDTNICCTQYNTWSFPINICDGDFGSPLILNYSLLVGIASFTSNPCNGHPNVFTDVSKYIDWITKNSDL